MTDEPPNIPRRPWMIPDLWRPGEISNIRCGEAADERGEIVSEDLRKWLLLARAEPEGTA
jgi:hypothetical protein